jgi:hypothetical protein
MTRKAGLHYCDYRSKQMHLKEQQFFAFLNSPSLEQFLLLCKHHIKWFLHYGRNHPKLELFLI